LNINEWRAKKEEGEKFTLPSGLVVKLKRVQLLDLAQRGEIPTPLVGLADQLLNQDQTVTIESFEKFGPIINLIISACMIEPKIADKPSDDAITAEELTAADRMAVYGWVNEILVRVRPFRDEPRGTEESTPASDDL
jgi:hypothetical protein